MPAVPAAAQLHEHRRAGSAPRAAPPQPPSHRLADISGNGRLSLRLPLPQTVISPWRQLMSPRSKAATSPARRPRRASSERTAQVPAAGRTARSQLSISRATSAGLTVLRQLRQLPAGRGRHCSCQRHCESARPGKGNAAATAGPSPSPSPRRRRGDRIAADETGHRRGRQVPGRRNRRCPHRPGTGAHPNVAAYACAAKRPFPGQVIPEPLNQLAASVRSCAYAPAPPRPPGHASSQAAELTPGLTRTRVSIGAASGDEPLDKTVVHIGRLKIPRRQPATHVRHQVDLARGRAFGISLAQKTLPEPFRITGQRSSHMATP